MHCIVSALATIANVQISSESSNGSMVSLHSKLTIDVMGVQ